MLQLKVNPGLADLGTYKKVKKGEIPELFPLLGIKLSHDGVVPVHIVSREVLKGNPGLKKHCLFKNISRKVKGIPGSQGREVQDIPGLIHLLVQQGVAALEVWLQQPVPVDTMRNSLKEYLKL